MPSLYRNRIRRFIALYLGASDDPIPFGGRDDELAALDAWLGDAAAPRNLLITAPAAGGKSALVVHWIDRLPSGWSAAFIPISIRYETNRPDVFFGALAGALANLTGQRLQVPAGDPAQFYRDNVSEMLDAWPAAAPPCVLVIDGLDEATGWELDISVLPPRPRTNLRIVVTAREMSHRDAVEWQRRIGWSSAQSGARHEAIGNLRRPAVASLLEQVRIEGTPSVRTALGDALFRLTTGDPLLLQLYVGKLLAQQKQGGVVDVQALQDTAPGFSAFFADWIDEQRKLLRADGQPFDEDFTKACLAILACAAGPLKHADLEVLVPAVLERPCIVDVDALRPIQRFLVGDGVEHGYVFAHPKFGFYVRDEWLKLGPWIKRADRAFLDWGANTVGPLNDGTLDPRRVPPYLLDFYFLHLRQADAPLSAWQALARDGWRRAWDEVDDGTAGYARDVLEVLRRARGVVLAGDDQRAGLALLVHCALLLSSIRSRGSRVSGPLLAAAVRTGVMTLRTAARLARSRFEPDERSTALSLLAEAAPRDLRDALCDEALAAANAIAEPGKRILAKLAAVATTGPVRLDDVLAATEIDALLAPKIDADMDTLRVVLPQLDPRDVPRIEQAAMRHCLSESIDIYSLGRAISGIGPYLSSDAAGRLLDRLNGRSLYDAPESALIDRVPASRLPEIVELAFPYKHVATTTHAKTLAAIAPRIEAQHGAMLIRLAKLFDTSQDREPSRAATDSPLPYVLGAASSRNRAEALVLMVPFLAPADVATAIDSILSDLWEPRPDGSFARRLDDRATDGVTKALVDVVPDAFVDLLAARLLQVDDQIGASLPLVPRMSPVWAERVLSRDQQRDSLAVGRHAADARLRGLLTAASVRDAVARAMDVDDPELSVLLAAALLGPLPDDRAVDYRRAVDALLPRLGSMESWRALKDLAPWLAEADVLRIIEASVHRDLDSCIGALAGHLPAAALPIVLQALPPLAAGPSVAGTTIGLRLARDFAGDPAIAGHLTPLVIDAVDSGRWRWEALVGDALRAMSASQRLDVAATATPRNLDHHARLRALLFEAEPGPASARYFAQILDAIVPPAAGTPLASTSSPSSASALPAGGQPPPPSQVAAPTAPGAETVAACIVRAARRIASAVSGDWEVGLRTLLAIAHTIEVPEARAEALMALLHSDRLVPDDRQAAEAALVEAFAATPREQGGRARLLSIITSAVSKETRRTLTDDLRASLPAIASDDDRLAALFAVLRQGFDPDVALQLRTALVGMVARAVPDLAREFREDLVAIVDRAGRWAPAIDLAASSNEASAAWVGLWTTLSPVDATATLVRVVTICAYTERSGLVQMLAQLVEPLEAMGGKALLVSLRDSARAVFAAYP